jgi:glutamate/tyrosine decarboxylase-like PLP-dependent enzyme
MGKTDAMRRAVSMIEHYLDENADARTPVVDYLEVRDLRDRFDFSLDGSGVALDDLLPVLESCLRFSVRTGHPQFLNQLYAGFSLAGFLGDMLASAVNTSMYTYEVAPVATLMEMELVRKLNSLVGFDRGEGIFCSGGSNANLLGVLCARDRAFPASKARGIHRGDHPVMFVSDQAHYSFVKAANVLGVGLENVIAVKTDDHGRMIPDDLDAEIRRAAAQGARPFLVGATAGTTVLGAIDPLEAIATICREHDLWMHVDGAWGGPMLLSEKHRGLLEGAALADSFTWDAHKMMGATLTCTAFLTRHRGALSRACGTEADQTEYLFHETADSALDLGKISLQCGRRVDPLRLWVMWRHHGDRGLARRIDRLFELTGIAVEQVARHPRLELMVPVQTLNVCFRYLPPGGEDVDAFNLQLRERLRKSGKSFVNYSHVRGQVALRFVFANPELTEGDVDRLFGNLDAAATELSAAGARRP